MFTQFNLLNYTDAAHNFAASFPSSAERVSMASGAGARDKNKVEMRDERFCDSKTEMCYFQI